MKIISDEQKFFFEEQYEARQQSLMLSASLVSIYDEKRKIKEELDRLLARNRVLEEKAQTIKDQLAKLQNLV